jgi:hypothetical protein
LREVAWRRRRMLLGCCRHRVRLEEMM